jgi:type I restriction enzyme S subunit
MKTKLQTQNQEEFKETEIGLIPKDWEVVKIKDIAKTEKFSIVDGPFGSQMKVSDFQDKGIPLIEMQHLKENHLTLDFRRFISESKFEEVKRSAVTSDDLVISKTGTLGLVAIIPKEVKKAIITSRLAKISVDKSKINLLCAKFILLNLKNSGYWEKIGEGSTMKVLTINKIANTLIPLPPKPEQQKIAFVLDKIQNAIEKTEQVIKALKELKKSLMKHLFTYGPVSLKEVKKVKLRETEIGEIPEKWDVVRLGELLDRNIIKIQFGFPCGRWNDKGIGIPQLRPFNITDDGNINLCTLKYIETDRNISSYILEKGDIIFNNTNSEELVGKTAYWDYDNGKFVLSNHMTIIRVIDKEKLCASFLAEYLHKKWVDGFYKTICRRHVNQSSISLARLCNVKVIFPPLPTQQKIASILSVVDERIEKEETKKKVLEELFKSMLHNLMTGKIRVKDLVIENES